MNTRLFSFIRRSALLVLALLSFAVSSASAQIMQEPIDGALSFDGVDDYVELPHDDAYNSNKLTIEARVFLNALPNEAYTIIGKGDDGGSSGFYLNVDSDGAVQLLLFGAHQTYDNLWHYGAIPVITGPGEISPGQWHHIAVRYRHREDLGLSVRIYVDGKRVGGGSQRLHFTHGGFPENGPVDALTFNSGPLTFGQQMQADRYLDGQIDEVRIWSILRPKSDIASTMDQPMNGDHPLLLGLWHLDDSPDELPTVADLTAHANHGTFKGSDAPDVVELAVADGVAAISAAGFVPLRADFAATDDPDLVGKIQSTQPAAGDFLAHGGAVYYIEYRPLVPDVVGQPVAEGVQELQALGFQVTRADLWATDDWSLVGTIAQIQPAAGTVLEAGSQVWYIEYKAQ